MARHMTRHESFEDEPNKSDAEVSSIASRPDDDLDDLMPLFRVSEQAPARSLMSRMPSAIDEDAPSVMPKTVDMLKRTIDDKRARLAGRTHLSQGLIRQDSISTMGTNVSKASSLRLKYAFANQDHWMVIKLRKIIKKLTQWPTLKLLQLFLGFYILGMTFFTGLPDPETGFLVDPLSQERTNRGVVLLNGSERAVVAASTFQVVALVCSRFSAFFMYPALVLVYVSKFRATLSFLARTPLAMFMESDMHKIHVYCGSIILMDSIFHTIFHTARWSAQGNLYLLFEHASGITGVILVTTLIAICIPMVMFKQRIKYELRKRMHYFFILFGVALCFHAPRSGVPNGGFAPYVFGVLLVWWMLDFAYCNMIMTEKIETTKFLTLTNGAQMTMNVSKEFRQRGAQGGYVYVCFPWIDKHQWHAFSLFENPTNPAQRQIYMQKSGDWTTQVLNTLQRETVRPVWVQGPYPSPYDNCDSYDNQILVASGIGITPALSVIRAHRFSRRVNLIWVCRDRDLLMFFLRHLYFDNKDGWNLIYYTGKDPLDDDDMEMYADTNVCIIQGRPNLGKVIPNIIYGIESKKGLPERYCPDEKKAATAELVDFMIGGEDKSVSAVEIETMATERGYQFKSGRAEQIHQLFMDEHTRQEMMSEYGHSADEESQCPSEAVTRQLRLGFKPWKTHRGAKEFVRSLDKQLILPTYGLLYCGGAKPVKDALKKISDEYGITLHIESFGW